MMAFLSFERREGTGALSGTKYGIPKILAAQKIVLRSDNREERLLPQFRAEKEKNGIRIPPLDRSAS